MKINLNQTELVQAIEHYLNTVTLKECVKVMAVKRDTNDTSGSSNTTLHVIVDTQPAQISNETP